MKNLIKRIIAGNDFLKSKFYFVGNYYKTSFTKNVLISYITLPFRRGNIFANHTNLQEALVISLIFKELGYNVDIAEHNVTLKSFSKYDIIFGVGDSIEQSFYDRSFKGIRIYYATGACTIYQNDAEIKRLRDVKKRRSAYLLPRRIVPYWSLSNGYSDALVVLGNKWTCDTYRPYTESPIYPLNATGFVSSEIPERNIAEARKNFFWFGSAGLVHKGLDLCLEFFSKYPGLELHICGAHETDFFEEFKTELNAPNVHFHGFIDVQSDLFKQIASKCLFTILPSCSEGQATSLLTTMGAGLIPVATISTGININELGIKIESLSVKGVADAVAVAGNYSEEDLSALSFNAKSTIREKHSLEAFKENMSLILGKIVTS